MLFQIEPLTRDEWVDLMWLVKDADTKLFDKVLGADKVPDKEQINDSKETE